MSKKFKCRNCGCDTFESFGVIKFANNNFKVLECIKCGNKMFLETKEKVSNENYGQFSDDFKRLSTKNDIKAVKK